MARPWKPSPTLQASFALHGAAALGLLLSPSHWPWFLGALVADHGLLTAAGLLPRCRLLGPNLTRLPDGVATEAGAAVAITIDDGPDPDTTPQVLDLLDAAGAQATFFCIGWRARQHPDLCREIVARGHHVENHGDSHSNAFSLFGPGRMKRDIAAAQATLTELTGRQPRFFRATAGLRNPFLDPVLHGLNMELASWTRRAYDTREGDPDRVFQRLSKHLGAGDILLLHDGHGALAPDGRPVILSVLPRLLQHLNQLGLRPVRLADACPPPLPPAHP